VEVLTGTARRRRWSDEEKAAIVAESRVPGAQASGIALRYGLHRKQPYAAALLRHHVRVPLEAGGPVRLAT
jgi:transposase-like protein